MRAMSKFIRISHMHLVCEWLLTHPVSFSSQTECMLGLWLCFQFPVKSGSVPFVKEAMA